MILHPVGTTLEGLGVEDPFVWYERWQDGFECRWCDYRNTEANAKPEDVARDGGCPRCSLGATRLASVDRQLGERILALCCVTNRNPGDMLAEIAGEGLELMERKYGIKGGKDG